MKSGKQRRAELQAKKAAKRREAERAAQSNIEAKRQAALAEGTAVDESQLAPNGSYGAPDFVVHGFYEDKPFVCQDCGKEEIWTAAQQKWWYEIAKGDVFTTARRCRPCRQVERQRRDEARRVHLEGLARKEPGAEGHG